jgi:hypothetical protein
VTLRLRDCAPVPHDLVQVDQAPNADVAQWTGHGPVLHACVSAACGHTAPPCCGCTKVRLRDWNAPPHDFGHIDQDDQALMPQSIGHLRAMAQVRYSVLCGHALPPNLGCVMVRTWFWTPPSHVREHSTHASQASTMQSSGHE